MKIAPLTLGLGVSMTCGYGALYYSFGVFAPQIAAHFGWENSFVFGLFSAGLLGCAFLAPVNGRLVDRFGARPIMIAGSLLCGLFLAAHGIVENPILFMLVIAMIPLLSIAVLYETGFVAITQRYGAAARSHITMITLIAGFASTVFWPLCQWLLTVTDWRGAYLAIAAIYLLGSLPVHLALPKATAPPPSETGRAAPPPEPAVRPEARRSALVVMSAALAGSGFMISALSTVLMVLLANTGFTAQAATLIGGAVGPAQVLARLIDFGFRGAMTPLVTAIVSAAATLFSILALALCIPYPNLGLGLVFGILMGVGQGLNSIVRGMLPLHFFGAIGYGRLTGNLSFSRIVASAAAPVSIVFIQDMFGIASALACLAGVALMSLIGVFILTRFTRKA